MYIFNLLNCFRGFDSHYGYWGGSEDYYTKWYRHGYDFRDQMELDLVANNTFSEGNMLLIIS